MGLDLSEMRDRGFLCILLGMEVLRSKTVAGITVIEFIPTPKMRLFAYAISCDQNFIGKDPEDVCAGVGIGRSAYKGFLKYDPHFTEWLEEVRTMFGGKNKRAMLEFVGMEKALRGDFQFWKPFAIKEGVINPDQLNHGTVLPANLGSLKDVSDDDLAKVRDSLLGSLRAVEDQRPIDMVEGDSGWEQASDLPGAPKVPEGPVALPPGVGSDRERALQELESF